MRAHLEDRAAALSARLRHAKAGIEETRIVNPKFPNQRVIRQHLRRLVCRYGNRLPRRQDVKIVWVQYYSTIVARKYRIPKIPDIVVVYSIHVDYRRMLSGFIPHKAALESTAYINSNRQASLD